MTSAKRQISWIKAAKKEFLKFPAGAQEHILRALDTAAEGQTATISKPMKGLGSGVFEIASYFKSDAFRVIYAVQLGNEIWVIHAFQKKSKTGIKTPKEEIDVIKDRLKRLKGELEK